MRLAAFDAKEFRRGGDRRPRPLGDQSSPGGFFSQLSAGVVLRDDMAFREAFLKSFDTAKKNFKVALDAPFCSAQTMIKYTDGNRDLTFKVVNEVLQGIVSHVESLRLNFTILTPGRTGPITQGQMSGRGEDLSASQMQRRLGDFMPLLSAWWMSQDRDAPSVDRFVVDNVQCPLNTAWAQLTEDQRVEIVPSGDEVCPLVCAADLFAWATDERLKRPPWRPLNRENLSAVWADQGLDVLPFFFNEKFLHAIKSPDLRPAPVHHYWRHPMVYFLVDQEIVLRGTSGEDDGTANVNMKKWVEEKGWMRALFSYAHSIGGAAKTLHETDLKCIQDGDTLVYLGERSKKKAADMKMAVEVETMSLIELRKKVP